MESTGITDKHMKMLYVGDTVRKQWGLWLGKPDIQEHVITKHVKNNRIEYRLGTCANIWSSADVEKV